MNAQFEAHTAANFLESGGSISRAGNIAALIACVEVTTIHSAALRLLVTGSMLCWVIACWFTVRVKIDASLFRQLGGAAEANWTWLDELLTEWGFRRAAKNRTVRDRIRGAITLWRLLALASAIQLVSLAVALCLDARI